MLSEKLAQAVRVVELRAQLLLRDQTAEAREELDDAIEEYHYLRGQEAWEEVRAGRKAGADA